MRWSARRGARRGALLFAQRTQEDTRGAPHLHGWAAVPQVRRGDARRLDRAHRAPPRPRRLPRWLAVNALLVNGDYSDDSAGVRARPPRRRRRRRARLARPRSAVRAHGAAARRGGVGPRSHLHAVPPRRSAQRARRSALSLRRVATRPPARALADRARATPRSSASCSRRCRPSASARTPCFRRSALRRALESPGASHAAARRLARRALRATARLIRRSSPISSKPRRSCAVPLTTRTPGSRRRSTRPTAARGVASAAEAPTTAAAAAISEEGDGDSGGVKP